MEARLSSLFKSANDYEVLEKAKGNHYKGVHYTPLFNYFVSAVDKNNAFRVLTDTYVTSDSGTGIVHQAPYFGEDDHRVAIEAKIITKLGPIVCPVDATGKFTAEVTDFVGEDIMLYQMKLKSWICINSY